MEKNPSTENKGGSSDTQHAVSYENRNIAISKYQIAKTRLMHISDWGKYCTELSAQFTLVDTDGHTVTTPAAEGMSIRINIPGPKAEGGSFDWVRIEKISKDQDEMQDTESLLIKVRPSKSPLDKEDHTSHFFGDDATSTFVVKREKNKVIAEIHGRNEIPNTHQANDENKLRNVIVAIGAIFGFSKLQWTQLAIGLVPEP